MKTAGIIVLYGLAIGVVVSIMQWVDYKNNVHSWSFEIYAGLTALIFALGGLWLGTQLKRKHRGNQENTVEVKHTPIDTVINSGQGEISGISKREMEVLQLMAAGCSNQEIADKLFVSLNTVKTHVSNLFLKLEVKRRTQTVIRAKELGILS